MCEQLRGSAKINNGQQSYASQWLCMWRLFHWAVCEGGRRRVQSKFQCWIMNYCGHICALIIVHRYAKHLHAHSWNYLASVALCSDIYTRSAELGSEPAVMRQRARLSVCMCSCFIRDPVRIHLERLCPLCVLIKMLQLFLCSVHSSLSLNNNHSVYVSSLLCSLHFSSLVWRPFTLPVSILTSLCSLTVFASDILGIPLCLTTSNPLFRFVSVWHYLV